MIDFTHIDFLGYDFFDNMLLEMYKISYVKENCDHYFVSDWGDNEEIPIFGIHFVYKAGDEYYKILTNHKYFKDHKDKGDWEEYYFNIPSELTTLLKKTFNSSRIEYAENNIRDKANNTTPNNFTYDPFFFELNKIIEKLCENSEDKK